MTDTSIHAKIRALLAKTTENGCTEAEMLSAMEAARKLMDKHGVTPEQVEANMADIQMQKYDSLMRYGVSVSYLVGHSLSRFCDVHVFRRSGTQNDFTVTGSKQDREFYLEMLKTISDFVNREGKNYVKEQIRLMVDAGMRVNHGQVVAENWKSFVIGALHRVSSRLREINEARATDVKMSDGKSLVVFKRGAVTSYLKDRGMRFRAGRNGPKARNGGAYWAGHASGDKLHLGRQVGGSDGPLRIGQG